MSADYFRTPTMLEIQRQRRPDFTPHFGSVLSKKLVLAGDPLLPVFATLLPVAGQQAP